jgi:hypothetical protein
MTGPADRWARTDPFVATLARVSRAVAERELADRRAAEKAAGNDQASDLASNPVSGPTPDGQREAVSRSDVW